MSPETLGTLGPIVVMVAIFYFLLYRPQKKQQSRRRAMLDSLKKGDQVITIGGIYGTIEEIGDKSLKLKISDGFVIDAAREKARREEGASPEDAHLPQGADEGAA
ncbi:preprotein translocase subunit YajC [Mitsuokella multacida]|uniref:preprotein translocase subunit YajC n=1 Tax=Mitsuokella multacida TaxID=52226 RepID=UPI003FEE20C8